jgi:hypothetical protein
MKSIFACSVVVLAQLALSQDAMPNDGFAEQSALEFQAARFKAMIEEDVESLQGFLADDLIYSHTTGLKETKLEFLASIESRNIDYLSVIREEVNVRIYGGVAVMTGTARVQGAVGDREVSFTMGFLDVSTRVGESWQLVAWQSTRLPEEEND